MKNLFAACISLLLFSACSKERNPVLLREATVTILHSTCVKTIVKIDDSNVGIGQTWSDTTKTSPVVYQQVFQTGEIKNSPTEGLTLSKRYKVKIYSKATGPDVVCDMFDPVNSPNMRYDIEFLP